MESINIPSGIEFQSVVSLSDKLLPDVLCLSQFQALPSPQATPGQILGKGSNLGPPGKYFGQMPCPRAIFRGLIPGQIFHLFITNE